MEGERLAPERSGTAANRDASFGARDPGGAAPGEGTLKTLNPKPLRGKQRADRARGGLAGCRASGRQFPVVWMGILETQHKRRKGGGVRDFSIVFDCSPLVFSIGLRVEWTIFSTSWGPPMFSRQRRQKREHPLSYLERGAPFWRPPPAPVPSLRASGAGLFFFEKATQPAKPPLGALAGFRLFCFGLFMLLSLLFVVVEGVGEGEMLYCITNRLNKGLISVDRNKRMLLYYLQYPVPTFKSSAKDLSHPIFGIVFRRATDTACYAAPARLKFMALERHRPLYLCACKHG